MVVGLNTVHNQDTESFHGVRLRCSALPPHFAVINEEWGSWFWGYQTSQGGGGSWFPGRCDGNDCIDFIADEALAGSELTVCGPNQDCALWWHGGECNMYCGPEGLALGPSPGYGHCAECKAFGKMCPPGQVITGADAGDCCPLTSSVGRALLRFRIRCVTIVPT